jgi:dihydropyrimidinase/allantoinase
MTFDLLISGGQMVTERGVVPGNIGVRNGRIAGLFAPDIRPDSERHISAVGLHVLPGVIDTHVHLRSPGDDQREDATSGTSAAAAGGITTLLEMPISPVPANSAEGVYRRAEAIQAGAVIDFGLYGSAGFQNVDRLRSIAEAGVIGFKTFLVGAPPEREDEYFGLWCLDHADLQTVMDETARIGLRHCFHCENFPMLTTLIDRLKKAGRHDGPAHAESRPAVVEDTSVAVLLAIAAHTRGPVQVVHLSSPGAAQLVREAKGRGLDVTAETCPQYLFLTDGALKEHAGLARCNPALRSEAEVQALWPYLFDGTLDVIGSDHCAYQRSEKEREDIFAVPPGLPGLESMLPMMLTAVSQGRLTLPELVRLMSTRAARLFHLEGKGDIAPGYDADLVMVDMKKTWIFDRKSCFSKARDTMVLVDGLSMTGQIVHTLVRGASVYQEGAMVASPGHGRWIRAGMRAQ